MQGMTGLWNIDWVFPTGTWNHGIRKHAQNPYEGVLGDVEGRGIYRVGLIGNSKGNINIHSRCDSESAPVAHPADGIALANSSGPATIGLDCWQHWQHANLNCCFDQFLCPWKPRWWHGHPEAQSVAVVGGSGSRRR